MGRTLEHAGFSFPMGYLFGLTLSTAGASTTFSVAAGEALDSTNTTGIMTLGSSINKTMTSWAVGSGNGSLDTGTIAASTWYSVFLIKRPDTGVVDILISLSATSPTMPANYTLKRRIGWMRSNGSTQWAPITQLGDRFYWTTAGADFNSGTVPTGSRTLVTCSAPPSSIAFVRVYFFNSAAGTALVIQPTAETDAVPSFTAAPLLSLYTETTNQGQAGEFQVPLDASSQLGIRSSAGTTTVRLATYGWLDLRGRLF